MGYNTCWWASRSNGTLKSSWEIVLNSHIKSYMKQVVLVLFSPMNFSNSLPYSIFPLPLLALSWYLYDLLKFLHATLNIPQELLWRREKRPYEIFLNVVIELSPSPVGFNCSPKKGIVLLSGVRPGRCTGPFYHFLAGHPLPASVSSSVNKNTNSTQLIKLLWQLVR